MLDSTMMVTARIQSLVRILIIASFLSPALAQQIHCDPELRPVTNSTYGYRLRGNRCEGIYERKVGLDALRVVSLTTAYEDFHSGAGEPLRLIWAAPRDLSTLAKADHAEIPQIHLRGQTLERRIFYRMDANAPISSTQFIWSAAILNALEIDRNDLGIAAWVEGAQNGKPQVIYLPLQVHQTATKSSDSQLPERTGHGNPTKQTEEQYTLIVLPGVELFEMFITVAAVSEQGADKELVSPTFPLNYGFYPAGRPISVSFSLPKKSGLYRVEIGANLRNGGISATDFFLYHEPSSF